MAFALILSSALLCAVLALDTGRLFWEGQELQRLADMAAMDAANGSTSLASGAELDDLSELIGLAEDSIQGNLPRADWGVATTVKQYGIVPAAPGGSRTSCEISECPATVSTYNAVNVTVTRETCASIIVSLATLMRSNDFPSANENCLTPAAVPLSRSATASRPTVVAFSTGSSLLTLCSAGSPLLTTLLTSMLGTGVCLDIVGPGGVLNADISLLELRDGVNNRLGLSVSSIDELLETQLTIGELVGSLSALPSSYSSTLSAINSKLKNDVSGFDLHISQLFSMSNLPGDGSAERAALATRIGLADLISTAVLLAHQCSNDCDSSGAINIPTTAINLGLVEVKELKLGVIQPPVIAIGPAGCENGEAPYSSEPGCSGWRTEAVSAQLNLETGLEVNLGGLLKVALDINLSGVGGRAGISAIAPSPGVESNSSNYDLSVGVYNEVLSGASASGMDLRITLLPALNALSVIENLLQGLLGILNLDTLVKVSPLDLAISSPLDLSVGSGGGIVTWPEENSISVSGTSLVGSINELLMEEVTIDTKVRSCIINLLGIRVCLGPERSKEVPIILDDLLPIGVDSLLVLLTNTIDQALFPLFDALGVGLNSTEVKILDVRAGSATLVI